ncbi:MAG: rhodanese-like domain-containing protein [bacterium]
MAWTEADIRANRDFFAEKLRTTKQRNDVLKAIEGGTFDFVLIDTRTREAFKFGHITGAWCAPLDELDSLVPQLPKDREIVTYCWGHD